jgi:hypothetical protein
VAKTSLTSKLAAGLSLVSLAAIPLLALLLLSRRRELRLLREQVAQAMSLEARQRTLLAGAGAGAGAGAAAPERGPTIYRVRKRWRRGILAAACAVIVAIIAFAAISLLGPGLSSKTSRPSSAVPVAVFNATSKPAPAQRFAQKLRADRIRLGAVGNINASLGSGVYVFYPPGAEKRARRVAQLIPNLSPTVAPIQPQVQNAVGRHNEIVVIFD